MFFNIYFVVSVFDENKKPTEIARRCHSIVNTLQKFEVRYEQICI